MKTLVGFLVVVLLGGCAPGPAKLWSPNLPAPSVEKIVHAVEAWPVEFKRPFFATIKMGDHRVTAQGVMEVHPGGESRLTATTESGVVIVDATIKGGEVKILRAGAGMGGDVLRAMAGDAVLALGRPEGFSELEAGWHETYAKGGFLNRDRMKFVGREGRMQTAHLFRGPWDALVVQVLKYRDDGVPVEVLFARPRYWYRVTLTFTDEK